MEWNRDTVWRQGSVISCGSLESLGLRNPETIESTIVIIASHDCDLAQDPQHEPFVEVVTGCLISNPDGNCTHVKNSRKLHLQFCNNEWVEFEAINKKLVCKQTLQFAVLDENFRLSVENRVNFQMWLASRYRRSAFPDEFEKRLTNKQFKLADKINKVIRPLGDKVIGVFFDVDEGEEIKRNGEDDVYVLDITILHASAPDIFEAAEADATNAANEIQKYFSDKLKKNNQWKGIELRSCFAISDSVLPYSDFKVMKRWRLDYISLAADPQQPVANE